MRDKNARMVTPTFGSRYMREAIPKTTMPQKSMDPRSAYHLIHDELQTQGNPTFASPALHKFHSGQVILGLVENGKPRPLPSACDFHLALPERKSGGTETIRLRGDTDVQLAIDLVIDERTPLLSTSVKRDREWIDWRPMGPYEASGPKAVCAHANQVGKEYRTLPGAGW